jgi:hypothetical protein
VIHARRVAPFVLALGMASAAFGQPAAQVERIAASFVLALGRTPTPAEAEQWGGEAPRSLADLLAVHRARLQAAPAEQALVLGRASRDAFGVAPDAAPTAGPSQTATYADAMKSHVRWIETHADDYVLVIQRAYRAVVARDAYSVEVDYWKRRPAVPFALLAASVENWALRNQPGLTATSGVPAVSVNSRYIDAVRLSASVAAEARAQAGLAPIGEADVAAAVGRFVVAPGAAEIVSVGGIHFVAAGSAALSAASAYK